jgi:L-aminopeptidase/D-esterase-like protein
MFGIALKSCLMRWANAELLRCRWFRLNLPLVALVVFGYAGPMVRAGESPRARDLEIPFPGTPGVYNAITDVEGVTVGHSTLISGEGQLVVGKGPVRTGVTAILPRGKEYEPVFAACSRLNGNGEMTGTTWIEEAGVLAEPILLSNTHSVGAVHEAAIAWRAARGYYDAEGEYEWAALPVVAETWDGRLNDIHGFHVKRRHVFAALDDATGGPVAEGNVGGGTGMVCYQFKGGIGTASRLLTQQEGGYTVGVLVQANYGRRPTLTIAGVPVGRHLTELMPEVHSLNPETGGHSIIVIAATDAPLLPHQLKRLANRIPLGIARVGGLGRNSSGDLFLAFSTANRPHNRVAGGDTVTVEMLSNDRIDPLFQAIVQATEEAIVNALVTAETMTGINENKVYALPHGRVKRLLKQYNRLRQVP